MEVENTDDESVTIHFDNEVNVQFNKSYLIKHSLYFEAMFSGYFLESQTGRQINIKVSIDLLIIKTFFFLYYII